MLLALLFVGISSPYNVSVDPVVRRGYRDGDCISIRLEPVPSLKFGGAEFDLWCCGGRLYGPYHEFDATGLDYAGVHVNKVTPIDAKEEGR